MSPRIAAYVLLSLCLTATSLGGTPSAAAQVVELKAPDVAVKGDATAEVDESIGDTRSHAEVDRLPLDDHDLHTHYRRFNTWFGATGGVHIVDAGTGAPGSVRMQLTGSWLHARSFLRDGDEVEQTSQVLGLSWTPFRHFELFGSVSNRTTLSSGADTGARRSPQHVMGDVSLGAKGSFELLPWWTVGGDISALIQNQVGDTGVSFDSTSLGLRALSTIDLRRHQARWPLIVRGSAQYWLDNSAKLVERTERRRYDRLPDSVRAPRNQETRHLVSRLERFGHAINRDDQLWLGLGLEAPVRLGEGFFVHPLVEWRLGIPVGRQQYACPYVPGAGSRMPDDDDSCLDAHGLSVFPHIVTLGFRLVPPIRGLAAYAAADVGLTSTRTHVRELAATAPYRVWFGVSYDYDARPPEVQIVEHEVRVEVPAPAQASGRIHGSLLEQETGMPIAGATVRITGDEPPLLASGESESVASSALASDAQGRFISYPLQPGNVQLTIEHPDYATASCPASVPDDGGPVQLRCELVALPRTGSVRGRVVDMYGAPLTDVEIIIDGPDGTKLTVQGDGSFALEDAESGSYRFEVRAPGYLAQVVGLELHARHTLQRTIQLVPAPARPAFTLRGGVLRLRQPLTFEADAASLDPSGAPLVAQLVDYLLRNPNVRLAIAAPAQQPSIDAEATDAAASKALAQRRAESLKDALGARGIPAEQIAPFAPDAKRRQLSLGVQIAAQPEAAPEPAPAAPADPTR